VLCGPLLRDLERRSEARDSCYLRAVAPVISFSRGAPPFLCVFVSELGRDCASAVAGAGYSVQHASGCVNGCA